MPPNRGRATGRSAIDQGGGEAAGLHLAVFAGNAHQKACASARVRNSIDSGIDGGNMETMPTVRWLDYDPIAVVVLMFGIGAVVMLALSI
jgi:hypothetical protein